MASTYTVIVCSALKAIKNMRFFATTHLRKGKSTHLVVEPLRKTFLKRVLRKGHLVVEQDIVVQVLVAEAPHKLSK